MINSTSDKNINNTLDDKYKHLVNDIIDNGTKSGDRTGTGTKKLFGRMLRHNMSEGFPLLTTKKIFWKGVLHELLWFLKGDTNIKYLVDNNVNIWVGDCYKDYIKKCKHFHSLGIKFTKYLGSNPDTEFSQKEFIQQIKDNCDFAKEFGEIGRVYGAEWINWENHINQIQDVINTLITNPDSRRMLVTAWNPTNVKKALLPSCHYAFQVVTKELSYSERLNLLIEKNKPSFTPHYDRIEKELDNNDEIPRRAISLMFNMRSVDVALGLPFDIASYGFLLSMIAKCVNMVPAELICCLADTHLYFDQIEPIKQQLSNDPYNLPEIKFNNETNDIFSFKFEDISIVDYNSHEKIYIPLSN